ncbi:Voltage-dependent T-type calcium channel subunit alpha-1G [Desmophyllum pertusum]|uniref:Voltage-dependent T-type calcium channel subunit alpha-1G n=1 Tax=Desmophyllum pertusum TaxID=174260 RepID=A0A9W9YGL7_9CNID|nr:Voltage-dependent T-type calcium channel subunit alpha-1G [Desmophyllum pertusum]
MSLEHYQMSQTFEIFVETANYFFTGVFVLEVIFKCIAFGLARYFKDRWNIADFVIVILSLAGILIESLGSTRKTADQPYSCTVIESATDHPSAEARQTSKGSPLVTGHSVRSSSSGCNLGLLFLLLFFIYSCLGIQLFGTLGHECSPSQPCQGLGPHAHFRNFGTAMLTLCRIATGDNWKGILEDTLRCECSEAAECEKYCNVSKYTAPLFFVTFVLAAQFVLVNVVIAVLMKHLKESQEKIAANMAAKDLEKKIKLLTISAKHFIRGKAKKSEPSITRRRTIVQLGLVGIELAQLNNCAPEKTVSESFCAEFARADAIFQEFLRLNANLQKVKMTIVRTASHNAQVTSTVVMPLGRQRRNTVLRNKGT